MLPVGIEHSVKPCNVRETGYMRQTPRAMRLGKWNPSLHFNRGMAAKYVEARLR